MITIRWLLSVAIVLALTGVVRAQEEPKPEDLKKMYQDTLEQLKDAQNRKTQLAGENAELQKKLADANTELAQLRQESVHYAEKSYFLRTHFHAWRRFMEINRLIAMNWEMYLHGGESLGPRLGVQIDDPNWPLSVGN